MGTAKWTPCEAVFALDGGDTLDRGCGDAGAGCVQLSPDSQEALDDFIAAEPDWFMLHALDKQRFACFVLALHRNEDEVEGLATHLENAGCPTLEAAELVTALDIALQALDFSERDWGR